MEFGKHIGKGLWGFADKALPALYGIAFMLFVIRTLPAQEYGAYVLFQTIFLLIVGLSYSFAIQPMLKFVSEGMNAKSVSSTALTAMTGLIIAIVGILILFGRPISQFLDPVHAENVRSLFIYLPIMLGATVYRLIAGGLFQARLDIRNLFWTDFVYYLLSLILIIIARVTGLLTDAKIVVHIGVIASVLSSLIAYLLVRPIGAPVLGWDVAAGRKIFNFGKYGIAGTIGSVVQTQFDTFIVSSYGGVTGVASYGVAKTFARIFDIYTQVIQTLVLPASSMLHGKGERERLIALVEKTLCFSFYGILPVILIFEFFPKELFGVIYGGRYADSIPLLRVLTLLGFFVPFASVISSVFYGIGKVGIGLLFSVMAILLSLGVYYGLGYYYGIKGIVCGVVIVQAIMIVVGTIIFKKYVPFSFASAVGRTRDIILYIHRKIAG